MVKSLVLCQVVNKGVIKTRGSSLRGDISPSSTPSLNYRFIRRLAVGSYPLTISSNWLELSTRTCVV